MIVLGADPGLTGALCAIDSTRGLLACEDIPTCSNGLESGSMKRWVDAAALRALLAAWSAQFDFARDDVRGAIERPIPMPTLPAQTIASQFDTFGVLRDALASKVEDLHFIEPRSWKKFFGLGNDKDASRQCCLRLYPQAPVNLAKHHNRAEAILIGHWLMRKVS